MASSYQRSKGRRENRPFKQLYTDMIKSKAFRQLNGNELKVLLFFIGEYNGSNNGNLMLVQNKSFDDLNISKPTTNTALKSLIRKGFILKSKQGGQNQPTLYALTCYPIDECLNKNGLSVHDLKPTSTASNEWRIYNKTLTKQ